jgi:hypothetical protein
MEEEKEEENMNTSNIYKTSSINSSSSVVEFSTFFD